MSRTLSLIRFVAAFLLAFALLSPAACFAQDATPPAAPPTPPVITPGQPIQAAPPPTEAAPQTAPPPVATESKKHSYHIEIGPELGAFVPTSSKTRNRFGSSWTSFGVGIGTIHTGSRHGSVGADIEFISTTGSNKHAYIVPLGVQYRRSLAGSGPFVPYYAISADIVFADLRSIPDNVHSGLRTGSGASVLIGTTITPKAFAEARYLFTSKIKSFDLSGLDLTLGLRFF